MPLPQRILDLLFSEAEKASLSDRDRSKVFGTIKHAQEILAGKTTTERRIVHAAGPWEPADFFSVMMSLIDSDRLNLTKAFDWKNDAHFQAHIRCVSKGISYGWVAYESETPEALEGEWGAYYEEVGRSAALRAEILEAKLRCHVLPREAWLKEEAIPFRITVFGEEVCLCHEERSIRTYSSGNLYFMLSTNELGFGGVSNALAALFDVCPSIAEYRRANRTTIETCKKYHNILRSAFLRAMISKFH